MTKYCHAENDFIVQRDNPYSGVVGIFANYSKIIALYMLGHQLFCKLHFQLCFNYIIMYLYQ